MSPDQLRSIFHVEHADLVPDYELVHLHHNAPETSHHHVRKRAIRTNPFEGGGGREQLLDVLDKEANHEGVRHGKKDLSKNSYFGATKKNQGAFANSDKPSATNKFNYNKVVVSSAEREAAAVAVAEEDDEGFVGVDVNLKDDVEVNVEGETGRLNAPMPRNHNVSLKAFGEKLHLTLTPTEGLFKQGGPHTLRMWTVKPNPNASQGLDYEEVIEVSNSALCMP